MPDNFIDTLIDWKDFEEFVKKLYESEGTFFVERNVIKIGKSGAKRQIDVKLTLKTGLHEFITIIECKKWKQKINRQLIDELFTTIEDLNASKGVMFTTKGYEEGAIQYAKYKNIDLFVVRDLTDEEWGLPGREIRLYFRMISGNFEQILMPNVRVASLSNLPQVPILDLQISQKQEYKENHYLYSSKDNSKGKHLLEILFDTRKSVMKKIASNYDFDNIRILEFEIGFDCNLSLDFTKYEYNRLDYPDCVLWLNKLNYKLPIIVNQYKFQHDRGEKLDFALIVENYISKDPKVVFKPKKEANIRTDSIKINDQSESKSILQNDTGFTIYTEPWVKSEFTKGMQVIKVEVEEIDLSKFYKSKTI